MTSAATRYLLPTLPSESLPDIGEKPNQTFSKREYGKKIIISLKLAWPLKKSYMQPSYVQLKYALLMQ